MGIADIREEMEAALDRHGLIGDGWTATINYRAKSVYGRCFYRERRIEVSWQLARLNTADETRDTILHEVAHAIAGPKAGHGQAWKDACAETGARPERCYDDKTVETPWNYGVVCDGCGKMAAKRIRNTSRKFYHFAQDCDPALSDNIEARRLRWVPRSKLEG